MEVKITEEELKELANKIVFYLLSECEKRNEVNEEIQVPANFVFYEYPKDRQQNHFYPAVHSGKSVDGYDYSVVNINPELAAALNNLNYYDFLELKKVLEETGVFHSKNFDVHHESTRSDLDNIAHEVHIFTTYNDLKTFVPFEKSKTL